MRATPSTKWTSSRRAAEVWIDGETNHGTTEFQTIDLDGDGIEEVVVGNRYGKLRVYRIKTGKLATALHSELGDVQMAAADLDDDGTIELLNGSSTGTFRCGKCQRSRRAEVVWEFPNHGYAVRDIKVATIRRPGGSIVVAGCADGRVVALTPTE